MTNQEISVIGVSVIMPTYNQASFIPMAINSLLNQSHVKWELIIINDGCTDDTDETVKFFLEDERVSYFKNLDNLGLGKCLNTGIEKAKFDLISYLPSDDVFFPEHLKTLIEAFEKNPTAILTFSGVMQSQ